MRILITGNKGYIGTVLVPLLLGKGYEVIGLDIGYYDECLLHEANENYTHIRKDIRSINELDLEGIDTVIHLAGLSNDPLGQLNPSLTEEINYQSTINLAKLAKNNSIKRFVYSSSQSMYGISNNQDELDEDNSVKIPLTSYAETKWKAEVALKKLSDKSFNVVCLRPSTVFGASPRLRCDIVFNNLVACAYTTGRIEIKSDGSPWRPVIHVKDVCSAFIAAIEAPNELVSGKSYNVGILNGNYTVKELAEAAQRSVPGSNLVFTGEHGKDSRSYKVSFKKILNELGEYYKPSWNLDKGGIELVEMFKKINFNENHFRGRICNRINQLEYLKKNKKISDDLRYI